MPSHSQQWCIDSSYWLEADGDANESGGLLVLYDTFSVTALLDYGEF